MPIHPEILLKLLDQRKNGKSKFETHAHRAAPSFGLSPSLPHEPPLQLGPERLPCQSHERFQSQLVFAPLAVLCHHGLSPEQSSFHAGCAWSYCPRGGP